MNKVTQETVDGLIKEISYLVTSSLKQTFCIITMTNGFEIYGKAGIVDATNYNKTTGEIIALAKAKDKIWEIAGYLLQEKLYKNK